jgi:2-polyprenyl-3-methyl-5-hydroxy-6-metoxy-1,4-benzoquinol methylase
VIDCPLCQSIQTQEYSRDKSRQFLQCVDCGLVFVAREQLITNLEEKERYEAHQNSEDDPRYVDYLQKFLNTLLPELKSKDVGLDFGCGRTTLLSSLFSKQQFVMKSFDLYFFPDEQILNEQYDFIVLSEVIEHLRDPRLDMQRLRALLRPGGKIFLKTQLLPETKQKFDDWFYKRAIN